MSYNKLNENFPKIPQIKDGLEVNLRPHQLTSIAAMRELEDNSHIIINPTLEDRGLRYDLNLSDEKFIGSTFVLETNSAILADKVGSGKTYMIIGLILTSRCPKIHDKLIDGTKHYSLKLLADHESTKTNLIIVPHNLTPQWIEFMGKSSIKHISFNTVADFNIFYDLTYTTNYDHDEARREDVVYKSTQKKILNGVRIKVGEKIYEKKVLNLKKVDEVLDSCAAIILNINRYNDFREIFKSVKWARVIIDEMDSIRVPSTFNEFGNFNWFVTATPTSIFHNSNQRYVNKIFGHKRGLMPYFSVKNTNEYIDSSIILPDVNVFMIETLLKQVIRELHGFIPKDVMEMINAGNMKGAVNKLNCNVDTEDNILKVLTKQMDDELHNLKVHLDYLNNQRPNAANVNDHKKRKEKVMNDINRCEIKLQSIHDKIESLKDECCFICTEPFDVPTIMVCCKSTFCLACIVKSLQIGNSLCPYCRHKVKSAKDYHVIGKKDSSPAVPTTNSIELLSKLDKAVVLEKLLKWISENIADPKVLIFSNYPETFDNIRNNITNSGLSYGKLAGTPKHISNVIDKFRQGTVQVIMLNTQQYGAGLNLQDANFIIMYHRMRSEIEDQVVGRAQRYGRKTSLGLIYLVDSNESQTNAFNVRNIDIRETNDFQKLVQANPDLLNEKPAVGTVGLVKKPVKKTAVKVVKPVAPLTESSSEDLTEDDSEDDSDDFNYNDYDLSGSSESSESDGSSDELSDESSESDQSTKPINRKQVTKRVLPKKKSLPRRR